MCTSGNKRGCKHRVQGKALGVVKGRLCMGREGGRANKHKGSGQSLERVECVPLRKGGEDGVCIKKVGSNLGGSCKGQTGAQARVLRQSPRV